MLLRRFTVDLIIAEELLVIGLLVSTSLIFSFGFFIATLPFNLELFTGSLIFTLTLFLALSSIPECVPSPDDALLLAFPLNSEVPLFFTLQKLLWNRT
ncbi:hypothetical protein K503DRAFT_776261 [Rhizopogon vinicolor AM-OR11-026]|uniref:Uncharacterized protein n=1 Tax=Rhizopogon vinicolor AM-OR11-026 TaxID=1314800 RepID=A0A1B7MJP0_9AGAM|nr:hypothetical protein K503DRAFT_776261 [Rhizopogon vinicolor AM-OR11-026]